MSNSIFTHTAPTREDLENAVYTIEEFYTPLVVASIVEHYNTATKAYFVANITHQSDCWGWTEYKAERDAFDALYEEFEEAVSILLRADENEEISDAEVDAFIDFGETSDSTLKLMGEAQDYNEKLVDSVDKIVENMDTIDEIQRNIEDLAEG